jgi:hypothetical protein
MNQRFGASNIKNERLTLLKCRYDLIGFCFFEPTLI